MDAVTKHCGIILEMVNDKIEAIHAGLEDGLDGEELEELYMCVKVKAKMGKIMCMEHDLRKIAGVSGATLKAM